MKKLERVLFTCGNGDTGKLGLGNLLSTTVFTACRLLPHIAVSTASCGNAHTAFATECGTVFTCGNNANSQLGVHGHNAGTPYPQELDIPEKIVSVSAGGAFTLALAESGALYGEPWPWGCPERGHVALEH
jgi:alpha-tubulin suppressor-like RCC1 family protein